MRSRRILVLSFGRIPFESERLVQLPSRPERQQMHKAEPGLDSTPRLGRSLALDKLPGLHVIEISVDAMFFGGCRRMRVTSSTTACEALTYRLPHLNGRRHSPRGTRPGPASTSGSVACSCNGLTAKYGCAKIKGRAPEASEKAWLGNVTPTPTILIMVDAPLIAAAVTTHPLPAAAAVATHPIAAGAAGAALGVTARAA